MQGGHAVVGLRGLHDTLLAAAPAAAAGGDASKARTLRLAARVLDTTLAPAAELSAVLQLDKTANNGLLVALGTHQHRAVDQPFHALPQCVDAGHQHAVEERELHDQRLGADAWPRRSEVILAVGGTSLAKFAHGRASNDTLGTSVRCAFMPDSEAAQPQAVPGLLECLLELARLLLLPEAEAALRDSLSGVPRAMGGGNPSSPARAAERADATAAAAAAADPGAVSPAGVDLESLQAALREREGCTTC
ncbi:hypothetical protein ABPG77_003210 [Micractinium sp. CCAP 211/92]